MILARLRRLAVVGALFLAGVTAIGCSGPGAAGSRGGSGSSAPGAPSLNVTVSGTLGGRMTSVRGGSHCYGVEQITADRTYDAEFNTTIGGKPVKFEVLIANYKGPNRYAIDDANVAVDGDDSSTLHWSSFGGPSSQVDGSLTTAADRSGIIDGKIGARTGPNLKGDGSELALRGSWRCG